MNDQGLFITFEGGDGAGKSTQADLLAAWLVERRQLEVVRTFEPGGTELGQQIRQLLLHGDHVSSRAEALLFAADRAHHVATVIRPALSRGAIVLCDRYIDSSVAYQGSGRALDGADIAQVSEWATEHLVPDLTVLLDIAPQEAAERRSGDLDRMERESEGFHRAVRDAFLSLATDNPQRYLVLDAAGPVDSLRDEIREHVLDLLIAKGLSQ